jgi:hypothetical protein
VQTIFNGAGTLVGVRDPSTTPVPAGPDEHGGRRVYTDDSNVLLTVVQAGRVGWHQVYMAEMALRVDPAVFGVLGNGRVEGGGAICGGWG